ncbi:MAG TPA: carboxypeptidase-like regulatory domain-containing protein, partial [Kofleriaceae bacterium]|nr:carboxypeptidase-like regulatory domain-containing protein [Kofleriaceae bacterium]
WRSRTTQATVIVEPNATAYVTLDLGESKDKSVHGVVRDETGDAAANVAVTALIDEREASTVRTDKAGRFSITTRSGAQLLARGSGKIGHGIVGKANVPSEVVDIVLDTSARDQ